MAERPDGLDGLDELLHGLGLGGLEVDEREDQLDRDALRGPLVALPPPRRSPQAPLLPPSDRYPVADLHPELASSLPERKSDVIPRIHAVLAAVDPAADPEPPAELTCFIEFFSVYKNYTTHEDEDWIRGRLEVCVEPVLRILHNADTAPRWTRIGLQMVYILARCNVTGARLESERIYTLLLHFLQTRINQPDVLIALMLALGNLTFLTNSLRELVRMGFVEHILSAIEANGTNPKLCEASIWALANLFYIEHDADLRPCIRTIVATVKRLSTHTALVCEACYALFNLASSNRYPYSDLMIELGVLEFLIHRFKVLRTTQYFVPALDLIARLVHTHNAANIINKNLEGLLFVTHPGPVEQFCFGQVSSFVPEEESIKSALAHILRQVHRVVADPEELPINLVISVRRELAPPSLLSIAAAAATQSPGLEGRRLPGRLQKLLDSATTCTACGRSVFGRIPIVRATVTPYASRDRYDWLCSKRCEDGIESLL